MKEEELYGKFPKYCQIVKYGKTYAIEQAVSEFNLRYRIIEIQTEFNYPKELFFKTIKYSSLEEGLELIKINSVGGLSILEDYVNTIQEISNNRILQEIANQSKIATTPEAYQEHMKNLIDYINKIDPVTKVL
jgi:hypothetical protein